MKKEPVDLLKILEAKHYRLNYVPKPENYLLKIDGSLVGSLGNFIIYTGLPKSGKSTFINAALASSFSSKCEHFKHSLNMNFSKNKQIGYFDTESSEDDFYGNIDRIKFLGRVKILPSTMNIFSTRECSPQENRDLIEKYLEVFKPLVLIIDGVLDIIDNFNDERESKLIIQWLKTVTKKHKCLIIGVCHLGKQTGHTLGHFGSMLDRYAQSVMEVVRDYDNETYTIKPKYLRSAKTWFKPYSIQWTGNDYQEIMLAPDPPPAKKRNSR